MNIQGSETEEDSLIESAVDALLRLRLALFSANEAAAGTRGEIRDLVMKYSRSSDEHSSDIAYSVPMAQYKPNMENSAEPPSSEMYAIDQALGLEKLTDQSFIEQRRAELSALEAPEALMLSAISTAAEMERHIRNRRQDLATSARAMGLSWVEIGKAAGLTHQAAMRRWDPGARQRAADYGRQRYEASTRSEET